MSATAVWKRRGVRIVFAMSEAAGTPRVRSITIDRPDGKPLDPKIVASLPIGYQTQVLNDPASAVRLR